MFAYVIFALSLCSLCFCDQSVKYAAVIYRHGDRTPVDTYPMDPYRNESLWPVKFGELTDIGKLQHYRLGQWLRKRYAHLLSVDFDPTEIYVRSSDVDRTIMSADVNLAGLYPPTNKSLWNNQLPWTPIPVHTVPEKQDEIISMSRHCVAFDMEKQQYLKSKTYKALIKKYQPLMDYLSANTGAKVRNFYDIMSLYSILYIESIYNFTLPNWTHAVYPEKMKYPAAYSFTDYTATPLMARIKVGPLLKQIMSNATKAMSNNTKTLKLSMYSAHDLNIGSFLNALGMYDFKIPVYTSTVLLELIYDNNTRSHSIRISYRNSTEIVEPHVLFIPHCGKLCPVKKFTKLYENLLTVDWDFECGTQTTPLLRLSVFLILGLFATLCIAYKIRLNKNQELKRSNIDYYIVDTTTHKGSVF